MHSEFVSGSGDSAKVDATKHSAIVWNRMMSRLGSCESPVLMLLRNYRCCPARMLIDFIY
jgi:hypothetical protein